MDNVINTGEMNRGTAGEKLKGKLEDVAQSWELKTVFFSEACNGAGPIERTSLVDINMGNVLIEPFLFCTIDGMGKVLWASGG